MCTAVVGGSIHRAPTRISAASGQRSTTTMTSHRLKDRRKLFRSGVLVCVFGVAVTFQNNSLGHGLPLPELAHSQANPCYLLPRAGGSLRDDRLGSVTPRCPPGSKSTRYPFPHNGGRLWESPQL